MKKLLLASTLVVILVPAFCLADVPLSQGHENYCKRMARKTFKKGGPSIESLKENCIADIDSYKTITSEDLHTKGAAPGFFRVGNSNSQ